jgi:hypothetical protein
LEDHGRTFAHPCIRPTKLSFGKHTVEIGATDEASYRVHNCWNFTIEKK